jgi:hypothetical protein
MQDRNGSVASVALADRTAALGNRSARPAQSRAATHTGTGGPVRTRAASAATHNTAASAATGSTVRAVNKQRANRLANGAAQGHRGPDKTDSSNGAIES